MNNSEYFDVVVVGGGHAGCEAYAASCRVGARTAMIIPSLETVGLQPCNPAVGGPGKGHLVREITALGGLMGLVTDQAGIQFRTLNRRKGPAVQSTRVQTDSAVYIQRMKEALLAVECGVIIEDSVDELLWENAGSGRRITGVRLEKRGEILARSVVVTTGTYLRGMLFVGDEETPGGRSGAPASVRLADSIARTGIPMMRLKTGTCPRIAGDSVDFSKLEPQAGDSPAPFFHPDTRDYSLPQRVCHVTWTGDRCHEVIARNLTRSAMYGGGITGIGPRYCPSIETKIARFPEKTRHQIFLEPEDQHGLLIYPAGMSTSFPRDVQDEMIHAIEGLEKARIVKYGYAVEYDAVQPQALSPDLMVIGFAGLFMAGQILGTSGYEEAGALGLAAGANAALFVRGDRPVILGRDQAYLGVMIDDLTGRGVDEPYRMFTSRAEYRLLLREDNADERLYAEGVRTGLIAKDRAAEIGKFLDTLQSARAALASTILTPSKSTNDRLRDHGFPEITRAQSLREFAHRECPSIDDIAPLAPFVADLPRRLRSRLEVDIKYEGYLERQEAQARKYADADREQLPAGMCYDGIPGLRAELVEKLTRSAPSTLGQAGRIPGMTPAAVEILRVYARRAQMSRLLVPGIDGNSEEE